MTPIRTTLVVAALAVMSPGPAQASGGLSVGHQIAVTRVTSGSDLNWRIWARRQDGHLVTAYRDGSPWTWQDMGTPTGTTMKTPGGVAAVQWVSGGTAYQRAYFIGQNNLVYEYDLNGAAWTEITGWPDKVYTGYVTAFTYMKGSPAHRYVNVVATSTDGILWVFEKDITAGGYWTYNFLSSNSWWSTTRPLVSSVQATYENYASVFGVRNTDQSVELMRWNGSWSEYNIGKPAGTNVCTSMAVTEGVLRTTPSTYKVLLFCTRSDAAENVVRYAYSTSATSTTFNWSSVGTAANVSPSDSWTLGIVLRPNGGGEYAIDGYALSDAGTDVYRLTMSPGGSVSASNLGSPPDTLTDTGGGVVAFREGTSTYSRGAFVGSLNTAKYLYTGAGSSATWPWEGLGAGDPRHQISGNSPPHVGGMIAARGGRVAAVTGRRNSSANDSFDTVDVAWSTDDGYTWGIQRELDKSGHTAFEQYLFPTVAFDDTGTAHIAAVQRDLDPALCSPGNHPGTDYLRVWSTTNGVPPFTSEANIPAYNGWIEYPYLAVQELPGADRLHLVYQNRLLSDRYDLTYATTLVGDSNWTTTVPYPNWFGQTRPALVAVTPNGDIYLSWLQDNTSSDWPMRVCRLGSGGMCEAGGTPPGTEVGGGSASWHTDGGDVAAGSSSIAPARSWSMVPSRAFAYRMYFVFQHRENSGAAKDVYVGWGTYDPVAHTWTWSGGPYPVAQFTDDGKDQFNPSLNVVWGGGTYESLHASWYDRRADCQVGTVACTAGSINKTNYCFRRRRSWSTTGSAWGYWQDSQVGLTDPACLPTTCDGLSRIWIGAYQDGVGPAMHSHHLWSEGITGVPWSGRLQEGFLSVGGFYTYP